MSVIINNVSLAAVAVEKKGFPTNGLPEFAFVGKSNVGKSSLINCMINRRGLARTSQNPGKTRTINFYNIEDKCCFVDLPGYGYAKISKSESAKWGNMIESYLLKREFLKEIIFLIDIRHEPSENDKMMIEWLRHYECSITVAATKHDKLSRNEAYKNLALIKRIFRLNSDEVLVPFSSETKNGREELWSLIEAKTEQVFQRI